MLEFHIEWEEAPDVADPLLRETWARLELRLDGRPMTRYWSDASRSLRDGVYGSIFPLAEWIADQWWVLLYEGNRLPSAAIASGRRPGNPEARAWLRRHNTLSCREGMAYPDLSIFRQDEQITLSWNADPSATTTPGRFIDSGMAFVAHAEAEAALESVVNAVIERTRGLKSGPAADLRSLWAAILASRSNEPTLCQRLGMLGLDPYGDAVDEATAGAVEDLSLPEPLVVDLLSASTSTALVDDVRATHALLTELSACTREEDAPLARPELPIQGGVRPYEVGYARAAAVRRRLGLREELPIAELEPLIEDLLGQRPRQIWRAREGASVEAAVKVNGVAAMAATQRSDPGRRFLLARALHHWLFVTDGDTPRLLTRGQDWSQAASRAFSAELLAPARALAARLGAGADWGDQQEELAREFNVSPYVIAHQLENHRLT